MAAPTVPEAEPNAHPGRRPGRRSWRTGPTCHRGPLTLFARSFPLRLTQPLPLRPGRAPAYLKGGSLRQLRECHANENRRHPNAARPAPSRGDNGEGAFVYWRSRQGRRVADHISRSLCTGLSELDLASHIRPGGDMGLSGEIHAPLIFQEPTCGPFKTPLRIPARPSFSGSTRSTASSAEQHCSTRWSYSARMEPSSTGIAK
jgi:hypothetical protein